MKDTQQSIKELNLNTETGTIEKNMKVLKVIGLGKPKHYELDKAVHDWYKQH